MQTIINAIKAIYNFFANFFENLANFVKDVFISIWELVKDFFYWIFETCINLVVSAVESIDASFIGDNVGAFGSLPAEILNTMGLLGMGTNMVIIFGAISIRLVLQLIPFTRLGS
jgi:hypothetical protein